MEVIMRFYLIVIGGVLFFGALTAGYIGWRSSIEREALLEYNQKQIEQAIKDQQEFKAKMDAIQASQDEILAKNKAEREAFDAKMKAADDYLNSTDTQKSDRAASDVLKKTVNRLKDAPK
jgi:hypothetical protein